MIMDIKMDYDKRILKLKDRLFDMNKLPYIIFNLKNIQYLTGFKGSNAFMVFNANKTIFITDSRYTEYAEKILPINLELVEQNKKLHEILKQILTENNLYVEDSEIKLNDYNKLCDELIGVTIHPAGDYTQEFRAIKDINEITLLKESARINDNCYNHLEKIITPGITEWDIYLEIENYYKKNGCRKCAFDPIVASGVGSSMPHYMTAVSKKINENEVILIDTGCEYESYNSDLTRTFFTGRISEKMRAIYKIVRDAQENAIMCLRSGMMSSEVDSLSRNYIKDAGYGDYFGHSLGHGVGLDIHEYPRIKENDGTILQDGMVITIEPGIYIPGEGGVRIEDMVVIKDGKAEVISEFSKDIIICG